MPQDDELFSGGSPAGREEKKSSHQQTHSAEQAKQAPNLVSHTPAIAEQILESPISSRSFKEMFAQQTNTQGTDESADKKGDEEPAEEQSPDFGSPVEPEEDSEGTLVTAQLVKAKTGTETRKTHVISALRKTIPHIRFKKEGGVEESEVNAPEGQLAIDVYETPIEVVIKSTIAGVKPEDLDVGIEENTINIRGSRHNEEKIKGENYFYQECYWGTFSRSIILPVEVDADKTQAALKDGILTIRLPKIVKEKEKKIRIVS